MLGRGGGRAIRPTPSSPPRGQHDASSVRSTRSLVARGAVQHRPAALHIGESLLGHRPLVEQQRIDAHGGEDAQEPAMYVAAASTVAPGRTRERRGVTGRGEREVAPGAGLTTQSRIAPPPAAVPASRNGAPPSVSAPDGSTRQGPYARSPSVNDECTKRDTPMSISLPSDVHHRAVLVIGAGALGARIALLFAASGSRVRRSSTALPTAPRRPSSSSRRTSRTRPNGSAFPRRERDRSDSSGR